MAVSVALMVTVTSRRVGVGVVEAELVDGEVSVATIEDTENWNPKMTFQPRDTIQGARLRHSPKPSTATSARPKPGSR